MHGNMKVKLDLYCHFLYIIMALCLIKQSHNLAASSFTTILIPKII